MSDYCLKAHEHPLHQQCHDESYGFPVSDDKTLYGRLLFEIFQAGLSWLTILKKGEALEKAFANFDCQKVAKWNQKDEERLMMDASIIRNRRKIRAAITNARSVITLQQIHGSFKAWLDNYHPLTLDEWLIEFRLHFTMMGPIVVHEFLMSTGYLKGAHHENCPIYDKILALDPPWARIN